MTLNLTNQNEVNNIKGIKLMLAFTFPVGPKFKIDKSYKIYIADPSMISFI